MLNVSKLKIGDIVKILNNNNGMGLKAGDTLRVIKVGYSGWDGWHYADCITDKGYKIEIMKNFRDFELIS